MAVTSGPIIEVRGLVKRFGSTLALNALDLEVPAGSVFGLLGPNGAGKTTAVRILATLVRPDAGRVRVAGHDVVDQADRVREVIGATGQYVSLDGFQSGRANLVMLGRLGGLSPRQAKVRAAELLDRFDLTDAADRVAAGYSGGIGATELVVTLAADTDLAGAADVLERAGFSRRPVQVDEANRQLRLVAGERRHIASDLIGRLSAAGVQVDLLTAREPSLDQVFLTLTGGRSSSMDEVSA